MDLMSKEPTKRDLERSSKLRLYFKAAKGNEPGLTQERVAKDLGWTKGNFNHYLTGRSPLNFDAIMALSRRLGFDPADLAPELAMIGSKFEPEDAILIDKYLRLPEDQQATVRQLLDSLLPE